MSDEQQASKRKCLNMIWANEAGVSVYIYEAEHERRTIEIHGVVNNYEVVLATATIEKHNRDRFAQSVACLAQVPNAPE